MAGAKGVVPGQEQWCNHDTPAIYSVRTRGYICECGAEPATFPTARHLADYLEDTFSEPDHLDAIKDIPEGGQYNIDLGGGTGHDDLRVIVHLCGWWLLLPYRSPQAEARR